MGTFFSGCIVKCLESELALGVPGAPDACVHIAELVTGGSSGMICLQKMGCMGGNLK